MQHPFMQGERCATCAQAAELPITARPAGSRHSKDRRRHTSTHRWANPNQTWASRVASVYTSTALMEFVRQPKNVLSLAPLQFTAPRQNQPTKSPTRTYQPAAGRLDRPAQSAQRKSLRAVQALAGAACLSPTSRQSTPTTPRVPKHQLSQSPAPSISQAGSPRTSMVKACVTQLLKQLERRPQRAWYACVLLQPHCWTCADDASTVHQDAQCSRQADRRLAEQHTGHTPPPKRSGRPSHAQHV